MQASAMLRVVPALTPTKLMALPAMMEMPALKQTLAEQVFVLELPRFALHLILVMLLVCANLQLVFAATPTRRMVRLATMETHALALIVVLVVCAPVEIPLFAKPPINVTMWERVIQKPENALISRKSTVRCVTMATNVPNTTRATMASAWVQVKCVVARTEVAAELA
jgi:hypothetical protein